MLCLITTVSPPLCCAPTAPPLRVQKEGASTAQAASPAAQKRTAGEQPSPLPSKKAAGRSHQPCPIFQLPFQELGGTHKVSVSARRWPSSRFIAVERLALKHSSSQGKELTDECCAGRTRES